MCPKFCGTLGAEGIQKTKIKERCHGQGKTAKERISRFLQWGGAAGHLSYVSPILLFFGRRNANCPRPFHHQSPRCENSHALRSWLSSYKILAKSHNGVCVCVHEHAQVFFSLHCLHESKVASKKPWNLHDLWEDHVSWQGHGSLNKTCSCPNAQLPGTGPHQPLLPVSPVPTRSAAALPFKETVSKYF